MPQEIERKFLVNKDLWKQHQPDKGIEYRQGYISNEANKTIRIRCSNEKGYITLKGKTTGFTRPEYEYQIPVADAIELLDNFCVSELRKIRYTIQHQEKLWEVDEFLGENEGLVTAEIELQSEDETFDLPEWIDVEVTGDKKYGNSSLSVHPFKQW